MTGACLAEIGHEVVCTDNDEHKISTLCRGALPIYEPGLEEVVRRNVEAGRLSFTADPGEAVRFGETIFICVGTPPLPSGDTDLSSMDSVARVIALESRSSKLVVEKSTVPMQTGEMLKRALATYGKNCGHSFSVASNPEFLREGTAILDFLHPGRIVIGVSDESTETRLRELYRPVVEQKFECPIHDGDCTDPVAPTFFVTSLNSAELIKHACNAFLALKISYANLIADICESLGADVEQVVQAMGLDSRIGRSFLGAGLGFGGFCLPKDIRAFIRVGEKADVDVSLLRNVETINKNRIGHFLNKARHALHGLNGRRIGLLGLAFKPGTDDIRSAPSLELISQLLDEQAEVQVYDPQAMEKTKPLFPSIRYCGDPHQVAEDADGLMIVTEWDEFRNLDWELVKNLMSRPLILDGRNLMNGKEMVALGFEYQGVGKTLEPRTAVLPAGILDPR